MAIPKGGSFNHGHHGGGGGGGHDTHGDRHKGAKPGHPAGGGQTGSTAGTGSGGHVNNQGGNGTPAWVIRRQQVLRRAGYNIAVDGVWGAQSQAAWARFIGHVHSATPAKPRLSPAQQAAQAAIASAQRMHFQIDNPVAKRIRAAQGVALSAKYLVAAKPNVATNPRTAALAQRRSRIQAGNQIKADFQQQVDLIVGQNGQRVLQNHDYLEMQAKAGRLGIHQVALLVQAGYLRPDDRDGVLTIQRVINQVLPDQNVPLTGVYDVATADGLKEAWKVQKARDWEAAVKETRVRYFHTGIGQVAAQNALGRNVTPEQFTSILQGGGPLADQLAAEIVKQTQIWVSERAVSDLRNERTIALIGAQPAWMRVFTDGKTTPFEQASALGLTDAERADFGNLFQQRSPAEWQRVYQRGLDEQLLYAGNLAQLRAGSALVQHAVKLGMNTTGYGKGTPAWASGAWNWLPGSNFADLRIFPYVTEAIQLLGVPAEHVSAKVLGGGDYIFGLGRSGLVNTERSVLSLLYHNDRGRPDVSGFDQTATVTQSYVAVQSFDLSMQQGRDQLDQLPWYERAVLESVLDPMNLVFGLGIIGKTGEAIRLGTTISSLKAIDALEPLGAKLPAAWEATYSVRLGQSREALSTLRDVGLIATSRLATGRALEGTVLHQMMTSLRRDSIQEINGQIGTYLRGLTRKLSINERSAELGFTTPEEQQVAQAIVEREAKTLQYVDHSIHMRAVTGAAEYVTALKTAFPKWVAGYLKVPTRIQTFGAHGAELTEFGHVLEAVALNQERTELLARYQIIDRLVADTAGLLEDYETWATQDLISLYTQSYGKAEMEKLLEGSGAYGAAVPPQRYWERLKVDERLFRDRLYDIVFPALDSISVEKYGAEFRYHVTGDGNVSLIGEGEDAIRRQIENLLGYSPKEAFDPVNYVRIPNPNHGEEFTYDAMKRAVGMEVDERVRRLVTARKLRDRKALRDTTRTDTNEDLTAIWKARGAGHDGEDPLVTFYRQGTIIGQVREDLQWLQHYDHDLRGLDYAEAARVNQYIPQRLNSASKQLKAAKAALEGGDQSVIPQALVHRYHRLLVEFTYWQLRNDVSIAHSIAVAADRVDDARLAFEEGVSALRKATQKFADHANQQLDIAAATAEAIQPGVDPVQALADAIREQTPELTTLPEYLEWLEVNLPKKKDQLAHLVKQQDGLYSDLARAEASDDSRSVTLARHLIDVNEKKVLEMEGYVTKLENHLEHARMGKDLRRERQLPKPPELEDDTTLPTGNIDLYERQQRDLITRQVKSHYEPTGKGLYGDTRETVEVPKPYARNTTQEQLAQDIGRTLESTGAKIVKQGDDFARIAIDGDRGYGTVVIKDEEATLHNIRTEAEAGPAAIRHLYDALSQYALARGAKEITLGATESKFAQRWWKQMLRNPVPGFKGEGDAIVVLHEYDPEAVRQFQSMIRATHDFARAPQKVSRLDGRRIPMSQDTVDEFLKAIEQGNADPTVWDAYGRAGAQLEAVQALARSEVAAGLYREHNLWFYAMRESQARWVRGMYLGMFGSLQAWKFATLPLRGAFIVRNVIDNFVKSLFEGVRDPRLFLNSKGVPLFEMAQVRGILGIAKFFDGIFGTNMRDWLDTALRHFWAQHPEVIGKIIGAHGIEIPKSVVDNDLRLLALPESDRAASIEAFKQPRRIDYISDSEAARVTSRHQPLLQRVPSAARLRKVEDVLWDLMAGRPENYQRRILYASKYRQVLRKTGDEQRAFDAAVDAVDSTLFDYDSVTILEENVKLFFPFIFFWRKNASFWAHQLVDKPWFFLGADRFYEEHKDSNSDLPEWMRRYVDMSIVPSLLSHIPGAGLGADIVEQTPGLNWLGAAFAKGQYFDPLSLVSVSAFYKAFKSSNSELPPDQQGWAFISSLVDGLNAYGLGVNPFLRAAGERLGILNRWAWRDIFPETTLLQSITNRDFFRQLGFDQGINIEDLLLDPIFKSIINEPSGAQLKRDRFNYYVQQDMAATVYGGGVANRAVSEKRVRQMLAVQAISGFAIGIFPRHISNQDLGLYSLSDQFRLIMERSDLTAQQKAQMRADLWDSLSPGQQSAYRLYRENKDNPGISPAWFDRYAIALTGLQAYGQIDDYAERQRFLNDHPDVQQLLDPYVGGRLDTGGDQRTSVERYLKNQALLADTEAFVSLVGEYLHDIDAAPDVLQRATDLMVTPTLKAFWDSNDTTSDLRARVLRGQFFDAVNGIEKTFFTLPDGSQQQRDYLSQHPELTDWWTMNEGTADDFKRVQQQANATFRDAYFAILDTGDWDAAHEYLRRHPFIFDWTKAEGRITPDGDWLPKGQLVADYHKVADDLATYYALPQSERRAFAQSHPGVAFFLAKYKATGGLHEHEQDYLGVKDLLPRYFNLPSGDREAFLDAHPGLRAYFSKYARDNATSQHARDYLAAKPFLDAFFALPDGPERMAYYNAHPELAAYFAKYGHGGGRGGGGTSQHAIDYQRIKPVLDAFFALDESNRGAYLAKHPELRAYFRKYSSGGGHGFEVTLRSSLAANPDVAARYHFWQQLYALPPDERGRFIHQHAADAGVFIYGSLSFDARARESAAWHRAAVRLGQSDRSYLYQRVAPLLDFYFKLPKASAERTLFLQANPDLQEYLQKYSSSSLLPDVLAQVVEHYFALPPYSNERIDYLDKHPELKRYFSKGASPREKAMQRSIDAYFKLPFGHVRDEYLQRHPEVKHYFDQRTNEHFLYSDLAAAFNESDPRMAEYRAMYEDIIPMDAMHLWAQTQHSKHTIYQTPSRDEVGRRAPTTKDKLSTRRDRG